MEGDALRGHLELLLLAALARAEQHGYALIEWLRAQSDGALDLGEGSVYPALRRLEARGLVTARWAPSDNNRRARYYELTPAGRKQLLAERAEWERFAHALGLILDAD